MITEKITGVSCTKQVEISTASIEVAADSLIESYKAGIVSKENKNKVISEFKNSTDELLVLNNLCKTTTETAQLRAEELEIK
ncbi:MAG: hypothetical protein COB09_19080 [Thalassobium sp.]|nr:MAG: hypothetical protein COB09_19080 [Thalassobium sp.]